MDHEEKRGSTWSDEELDLIVTDHFDMLAKEMEGKTYVKRQHSNALMKVLHRSHRSVEFKHQNISAVLDQLGLPWIPGYKPKVNFQNAIFEAIDRYLSTAPSVLTVLPAREPVAEAAREILVEPPVMTDTRKARPLRLQRLVRKFDPIERDKRNRHLGTLGERFVLELERNALRAAGCGVLAEKVRWVSDEDGDGAGFDIESYDIRGRSKLIEVKTTNGAAHTPFYISRTEMEIAEERQKEWRLYRVHLFATSPKIFTLAPPLRTSVHLTTELWSAAFS